MDANGQRTGNPFHIEVFDTRYCDWVGKGNAGLPIRHRQNPGDFPVDPAQRATTVLLFLCGPGAAAYYTDSQLHRDAYPIMPESGTPSAPFYVPGWMLWLRNVMYLLAGLLLGWLLRGWLD